MTPRTTLDVQVWGVRRYKGKRKTTYTVRWRVEGRILQKTFDTIKLAESFRGAALGGATPSRALRRADGTARRRPRQAAGALVDGSRDGLRRREVAARITAPPQRHRRGPDHGHRCRNADRRYRPNSRPPALSRAGSSTPRLVPGPRMLSRPMSTQTRLGGRDGTRRRSSRWQSQRGCVEYSTHWRSSWMGRRPPPAPSLESDPPCTAPSSTPWRSMPYRRTPWTGSAGSLQRTQTR